MLGLAGPAEGLPHVVFNRLLDLFLDAIHVRFFHALLQGHVAFEVGLRTEGLLATVARFELTQVVDVFLQHSFWVDRP